MATKKETSTTGSSDNATSTVVAEKEEKRFNPLENRKVYLKPIIRKGQWLSKDHSGGFMYDNTTIQITLPIDRKTGSIKNPLTAEEQAFFEDIRNSNIHGFDFNPGDLSPKKKTDNFWKNYEVKIHKTKTGAIDEDTTLMALDLSDADQFLRYKVLKACTGKSNQVSPNWDSRYDSAHYRVALVEEGEEDKELLTKASMLKTANKFFYSIDNSPSKMFEFLSIFYLENKNYNSPPENAKTEWYVAEIQKLINERLDDVHKIVTDKETYKAKLLVQSGVKVGAITFNRYTGFETADGKFMGVNMQQAVSFVNDDKNQETVLKLKGQIDINS